MKKFYPIIKLSELPPGKGTRIEFNKKEIALFRQGNSVFAVQNQCPHQQAELADGYIKNNKLYCYLHHWAFDLSSGAYAFNQALKITMYDVRIENDQVLIAMDE